MTKAERLKLREQLVPIVFGPVGAQDMEAHESFYKQLWKLLDYADELEEGFANVKTVAVTALVIAKPYVSISTPAPLYGDKALTDNQDAINEALLNLRRL